MNYEVLKAKALEYARTNTSETTEEQTAAEISSALTILEKAGISLPPVDDSYEQALYANYKELTAYGKTPEIFNRYKQNLRIMRSFFEWLRKENITMKDNEEKTAKKMGRKILDPSGEKRTVKLGTYVTSSLYKDIQALALFKRKTIGEFVNDLLIREAESNSEKLNKFKELMDD